MYENLFVLVGLLDVSLCAYKRDQKRLSVTKGCYVCYVSTTMYSIGKLMLINPSYYFISIYSFEILGFIIEILEIDVWENF